MQNTNSSTRSGQQALENASKRTKNWKKSKIPIPQNPKPHPSTAQSHTRTKPKGLGLLSSLSNKELVVAQKNRQNSIRQLVIDYLAQYPEVDLSYAETMFQDECKSSIFKVVAQMVADKKVPVEHIEEAFSAYSWLAAHEPTPEDDFTKKTLVHYACLHGRHDVLTLLLTGNYRPRVTAQDEKGYIPLHTAAKAGAITCVELVYDYANEYLELCDYEGRTALMIAAFFNQKDVVRQLLESPTR